MSTVSYVNPTATTPTAAGMLALARVVAQVVFSDADTTAVITHNMNIPLASTPTQHGQNSSNPIVIIGLLAASTVAPIISFARGTNTVTLTKGSILGSNSTIEVQIERHEIIL
jgi:hypothetical protein